MNRVLVVAVLVLAAALAIAGCVGPGGDELDPAEAASGPAEVPDEGPVLEMELPIHVVAVGSDLDEDRLRAHLDSPDPSYILSRAQATGAVDREPLQYDVTYQVHHAPEAFAEELFTMIDAQAEPRAPSSFLEEYDRDGPGRICSGDGPCDDVRHVDAEAVEDWIAENRGDHGLDFPEPGYTFFVLDHHTEGYLPRDTYHQYTIGDAAHPGQDRPVRAWGGNHDLVFLDVSAGPNAWDFRPWDRTSGEESLSDRADRPVWDHDGDGEPFHENLARNVEDAVEALWARSPNRPVDYADRYVVPYHIVIDPNTRPNPGSPLHGVDPLDVPDHTEEEKIEAGLDALVPWAEVETEFHYIYLPDDDPGMHRAVEDAKVRDAWDRDVDMGVLRKHVHDNWDAYVPDDPDARVHPMFLFWLEAPNGVGTSGYSDDDAWGDPFAAFSTIGDVTVCPGRAPPTCTPEDRPGRTAEEAWRVWNSHLVHEIGHSFGLNHPFQAYRLDPGGEFAVDDNWLWGSIDTAMGYRTALASFTTFEEDFLARHHTAHLVADVLRDDQAPQSARDEAGAAIAALEEGRSREAVDRARGAWEAAGGEGVLAPPSVGETVRGETATWTFHVPAGDRGLLMPGAGGPWPKLPPEDHPSVVSFPVEVPDGAVAVEVAYEEAPRPLHPGWAAVAGVFDDEGDAVATLSNNAWDAVVLRDLARCADGCQGLLYSYGSSPSTYEVRVTPILSAEGAS